MTDDDVAMVICQPVNDMLGQPEQDSVHRWCFICAATVWAAPSTLRFVEANPKAQIVCNDCAPGMVPEGGEMKVEPVPGADTTNPRYRSAIRYWRQELGKRRG